MSKVNIHNTKQMKEIHSLLDSIEQQHQKNQLMFTKISSSGTCQLEIIDAEQFINEINMQMKHPKFMADVLIRKCQEMIDKLLSEEYSFDRALTRLKSRRRRNNNASTGDVLQQIDTNFKEIIKIDEKPAKIVQNSVEEQEEKIIVHFTPPVEIQPIDKLTNLNYQVEYCINMLNKETDWIDDDIQVVDLKCKLQQLTENKVYSDENVEVYVVYKDGKKRVPNLQIQY